MRNLFWVLLVVNVLFFAWMNLPTSEKNRQSAVQKTVQQENALPILLLKEISQAGAGAKIQRLPEGANARLLGGFENSQQAMALLQRLMSLGIDGVVVEQQQPVSTEYVVYIPAGDSKRLALRKIDQLEERGISAALVEEDSMESIILIDSFAYELAARSRVRQLLEQGHQVEVRKIEQSRQSFWVNIARQSERLLDERMLEALKIDFPQAILQ